RRSSRSTEPRALDDPRADRVNRGLDAVLDLELHQDACDVVLHRLRADEELRGDRRVALALRQQAKHLDLPLGETRVVPGGFLTLGRVLTQPGQHLGRDARRYRGLTRRGGADA